MKKFSHRGLINKDNKENTLGAFKDAHKNGFDAIELDIWFVENQLVLHHDQPKNLHNLTTLKDLFLEFHNKIEYWCDFKNLSLKNCDEALKNLKEIVDELKIDPKKLYLAPFITDFNKALEIYKIIRKHFGNSARIIAVKEKLPPKNYSEFCKKLKDHNIYGLSIQYSNIRPNFKKIFSDVKIFAWTVNDQKISDYLSDLGIENITTDELPPHENTNRKTSLSRPQKKA